MKAPPEDVKVLAQLIAKAFFIKAVEENVLVEITSECATKFLELIGTQALAYARPLANGIESGFCHCATIESSGSAIAEYIKELEKEESS